MRKAPTYLGGRVCMKKRNQLVSALLAGMLISGMAGTTVWADNDQLNSADQVAVVAEAAAPAASEAAPETAAPETAAPAASSETAASSSSQSASSASSGSASSQEVLPLRQTVRQSVRPHRDRIQGAREIPHLRIQGAREIPHLRIQEVREIPRLRIREAQGISRRPTQAAPMTPHQRKSRAQRKTATWTERIRLRRLSVM
jgi:hypothetical protein